MWNPIQLVALFNLGFVFRDWMAGRIGFMQFMWRGILKPLLVLGMIWILVIIALAWMF